MLDLKPAETVSYVALRVIAGLAFSFHGMAKLFGVLSNGTTDDSQMWIGGVIELGGLLIAAGLLTRAVAFLYCFLFLFIAMRGPGRAALDNLIFKQR